MPIFIPQKDFKDESLSLMKLILDKWGVELQDRLLRQGRARDARGARKGRHKAGGHDHRQFDGIVFIDGKGIDEQKLYDYRPLLDIVTHFNEANKYLVAIGNAAKIPIRANIVKAKKIAVGDEETMRLARLFNGIPSKSHVEAMGNLITIKSSRAVEDSVETWLQHIGLM